MQRVVPLGALPPMRAISREMRQSMFAAGNGDWGTYQRPGNFKRMQNAACTPMLRCHLIGGAGHWVQQEQPAQVSRLPLDFLCRQA